MSRQNAKSFKDVDSSVDLLADPEFRSFMDKFAEHENAISHLPLSEQRKLDAEFILKQNKCHESVNRIVNLEILGTENNNIPIRIYVPNESNNLSVIMYFHGGGWVYGGIEEADAVCRRLANHLYSYIQSLVLPYKTIFTIIVLTIIFSQKML